MIADMSLSKAEGLAKVAKDAAAIEEWTDLPLALRDHLFERAAERKIAGADLLRLRHWRQSEPDAPDGRWFKDFGSFKICGEGRFPKTFLLKGQAATGEEL